MEQTTYIPTCSKCGTPMLLKEKNGEKFWGCPNYRQCGGKTKPYGSKTPKQPQNLSKSPTERQEGIVMVMDELAAIQTRLDKLISYIITNLPPKNGGNPQK